MTTTQRYYFQAFGTAPVAVAASAGWNVPPGDTSGKLNTVNNAAASAGANNTLPTGLRPRLGGWVSDPLPAGPLAGTVRGAWAGRQGTAAVDAFWGLVVRVVSGDGLTVRGTLLAFTTDDVEFPPNGVGSGNYNRRYLAPVALTPVTAQAGDRLHVEIGAQLAVSGQAAMRRQYGGAADIAASDAATAESVNNNPWVEFEWADPPPDPPLGLVVTDTTGNTISVDWTAPATGVAPTGYEVRIDGGAPLSVGLATDHVFTALTPGTLYTLEVRTVAASGTSGWVQVTATTDNPQPADRRFWTQRLAEDIGIDPVGDQPIVEVRTSTDGTTWTVDPDLSDALAAYQVTYGRKDATSRLEAVTASLTFATALLTTTPTVGMRLQVALSPDVCTALGITALEGVRFTGDAADPTVDYDARLTHVSCVGRLGRAYRRSLDGTTWPVEDDGDRISRVLSAVGVDVGTIDAGSVNVAAPTQSENVSELVEAVEVSALGRVVEQPDGSVDYHDAEHRRGTPVAVTLDSSDVFRRVTWTQRLASLVNRVDVKIAAGTVHTTTDPESADENRYGLYPATADTALTNSLDALELGTEIVGRRADPSWTLPDLTVDMLRTVDLPDLPDVLTLRFGSLVELTGLPSAFPLPDGMVYAEGYTETATPRAWQLVISVSDPAQSGAGIRWVDVPDSDAYQWQDIDLEVSWFDAARIVDPAALV